MKTKFTVEVLALAGLVAGLAMTTGCRTTYSDNADLSLTPMPESLNPEPVGDVKLPAAAESKPLPYWKANPEAVSALDKVAASGKPPANASYSSYTVKAGDSLGKIAQAHGIRLADLKAANLNVNPDKIKVGQTIFIPAGSAVKSVTPRATASTVKASAPAASAGTYVVKQGDILGRIARANGVKVADLKKANNLTSDKIKVGQKLVIPGKAAKLPPGRTIKDQGSRSPVDQPVKGIPVDVKGVLPTDAGVKPVTPPAPVIEPPAPVTPPAPVIEPPAPVTPPVVEPVQVPVVEPVPVATPDVAIVPPVTAAQSGTPYTVQEGQDLFDIAVRWSVSADAIKKLNGLTSDEIHPGQTLLIPSQQAQ